MSNVEEAGRAWGGLLAPPRLINERENAVYEAVLQTGARVALRLHRTGYQSQEAIRSELVWTAALADQGFPCPRPVPTQDGALVHRLASGQCASVVSWIDAAPIGENGVPFSGTFEQHLTQMQALGKLTRQMHDMTEALDTTKLVRPRWDLDGLLGDTPHWGHFWLNPSLTEDERSIVQEVRENAAQQLFENRGLREGLIHADMLQENVLQDAQGLYVIDFDDSGFGYHLFDLGTALIQHAEHPQLAELSAALCDGYGEGHELMPLFMMLRAMASAGWIMLRAAPDDPRQRFYAERMLRCIDSYRVV